MPQAMQIFIAILGIAVLLSLVLDILTRSKQLNTAFPAPTPQP